MEYHAEKILAIDDNHDNLIVLKALITDAFPGAIVLSALNGRNGLDIAVQEAPDVILLDIIMPGMDGYEVCRRLKADKKSCDIPVVFITSMNCDKESRIMALECGAEAFLTKPIDGSELMAQIRAMIKIRIANIEKRFENERLAKLVEEKTRELENVNKKALSLVDELRRENEARKISQGELARSESKYRQITENISDLVWIVDMDLRTTYISPSVEKMLGESPEVHMKKAFYEKFTPSSRKIIHDVLVAELEQEKDQNSDKNRSRTVEVEHYRADGSVIWVSMHTSFLRDENDRVIGCQGVSRDITERKMIEHELKLSEERFQHLFDKAPLGYQSLDFEGRFIEVNQKWLDILGYRKEEVIGKWFGDFLHPEYVEGFRKRFPIFKSQGFIHSEFEMLRKDGQRLTISFEGKIGYDADGAFKQTHCILQDVTDQRKVERALIESEERYKYLFEYSGVGIGYYTTDGVVISINKKALENLGGKLEDYVGKSIVALFPKETADEYFVRIKKAIASDQQQEYEDYLILNSKPKWVSSIFTRTMNISGGIIGVQIASLDITERKKMESDLLYLSYHDHLTNFYNRRFFEKKLEELDTTANLPLSIIICDINGLKLINDSFGHEYGDKLLAKAAETIRKACRTDSIICRIGGDEFAILLPNADAEETVRIADNIKQLASSEEVENIELSISYGYETKTNDKQKMTEVMANAENHMYRHKLYERSSTRSKTIEIIMNTLFEKSNRESQHSNRVSSICMAIASKMNINQDDVNKIGIAGLVHDIGKIGIDEKILNKAGRLSSDEREQINRHPEVGWRILSSVSEFSELAQFILDHHEKWDGSGYPNGLIGVKIPLEARIIAVADAYDAMTSERSYRTGVNQEEAVHELKRCSGTHFDPEIVEVFIERVMPYN